MHAQYELFCIAVHMYVSPQLVTVGFEQTSYTFSESDVRRTVIVVASQRIVNIAAVNIFASVVGGMFDIECTVLLQNTEIQVIYTTFKEDIYSA